MERKLEVEFTDEEKKEYKALDDAAREFYVGFKASKGHELSKHFLLLSQKLTPLRIAASGGQIPLDDDEEDDEPEETEDEPSDDEAETKKKKKRRKEVRFSDFVYRSKLEALLVELKRARDDDPQGTIRLRRCSTWHILEPTNSFISTEPSIS